VIAVGCLQLAARDRRITALEQEAQTAQEVHGTPRRSVRAAASCALSLVFTRIAHMFMICLLKE
jgi:hypothetical protein